MLAALLCNLKTDTKGAIDVDGWVPDWALRDFWLRLKKQAAELPKPETVEERKEFVAQVRDVAEEAAQQVEAKAKDDFSLDHAISVLILELELRVLQERERFNAALLEEIYQEQANETARRKRQDDDAVLVLLMG